jgi:hypothetical protein
VLHFSSHPHCLHRVHGTVESRTSGTSSCCWDPAQDRRAIRFLGSVVPRLLANEWPLPLRQLQVNNYFIYNGSALRSSCIDCVRLYRLRSLTMSDIGMSGDAVTQPSTGYSLKLVFMFISCLIMNRFMFNCCLNINTCTWIVSPTAILKCLFKYGIKINKNIAYHLTFSLQDDFRCGSCLCLLTLYVLCTFSHENTQICMYWWTWQHGSDGVLSSVCLGW